MTRLVVIAVVVFALGANALVFNGDQTADILELPEQIQIDTSRGPLSIRVEYAITEQEKYVGLMDRDYLEEGSGMLFVYDKPLIPSFWMKNTIITLDIIFIDDQGLIRHIHHLAEPCINQDLCSTYSPPVPVQYVLEVPGGYVQKHGIQVGDTVQLN